MLIFENKIFRYLLFLFTIPWFECFILLILSINTSTLSYMWQKYFKLYWWLYRCFNCPAIGQSWFLLVNSGLLIDVNCQPNDCSSIWFLSSCKITYCKPGVCTFMPRSISILKSLTQCIRPRILQLFFIP